jgi:hypothetical protein
MPRKSSFRMALLARAKLRFTYFFQLLIETRASFSGGSDASFDFKFLVVLPRGSHPFPSRTRKLSLAGPMILRW